LKEEAPIEKKKEKTKLIINEIYTDILNNIKNIHESINNIFVDPTATAEQKTEIKEKLHKQWRLLHNLFYKYDRYERAELLQQIIESHGGVNLPDENAKKIWLQISDEYTETQIQLEEKLQQLEQT
jgi:hypothetical protein